MDNTKLKEYAQLKLDSAVIDAKIKALAPGITAMIELSGADKVNISNVGMLTVEKRRTYIYSDAVKDVESRAKMMKDDEKATGKAKFTESSTLKFFAKKPE